MLTSQHNQRLLDWLAIAGMLVLGALLIIFNGVTFHGPDQMRDIEVARRLIHFGEWPISGPTLFNAKFQLPPGFYYLLALPLLAWDSESSVFIAFGALFIGAVWFLWRTIREAYGSIAGLAYVILAFPLFSCIYVHSAWNPALVMTLSSIVLALVLGAEQTDRGWTMLVVVAFALLQIHPSSVPILLGVAIFMLSHFRRAFRPWTLGVFCGVAVVFVWWLDKSGQFANLGATASDSLQATNQHGSVLSRLLDGRKWATALLMPMNSIKGIVGLPSMVYAIASGLLWLLGIGVLLGVVFAWRNAAMRWVVGVTALWFLISMSFLSQGAFWHLDVIYPWLAVLAAYGWRYAAESTQWTVPLRLPAAALGLALLIGGHSLMYLHLEDRGRFEMRAAPLFFPPLDAGMQTIPAYTYLQQKMLKQQMATNAICDDDLAGKEKLIFGNMSIRMPIGVQCAAASERENSRQYFLAYDEETSLFRLTDGLRPVVAQGGNLVYAIDGPRVLIDGQSTANLLSTKKINYMLFEPARMEHGAHLSFSLTGPTLLRVALRCANEYALDNKAQWKLTGARELAPFVSTQAWHLGSIYYDLEWVLAPASASGAAAIASITEAVDCDVSAVARQLPATKYPN